mmetsp:Transcript_7235/g.21806  ORF Transcript_7235/g.21806 Transcript_7235/m.21806 type:complete len:536 (-) Transcript_7235:780-2387(-)
MNDQLANSLSAASTGLQTKDEYKRKREELLQAAALGKLAPAALDTMESNAVDAGTAKKKKKKKKGAGQTDSGASVAPGGANTAATARAAPLPVAASMTPETVSSPAKKSKAGSNGDLRPDAAITAALLDAAARILSTSGSLAAPRPMRVSMLAAALYEASAGFEAAIKSAGGVKTWLEMHPEAFEVTWTPEPMVELRPFYFNDCADGDLPPPLPPPGTRSRAPEGSTTDAAEALAREAAAAALAEEGLPPPLPPPRRIGSMQKSRVPGDDDLEGLPPPLPPPPGRAVRTAQGSFTDGFVGGMGGSGTGLGGLLGGLGGTEVPAHRQPAALARNASGSNRFGAIGSSARSVASMPVSPGGRTAGGARIPISNASFDSLLAEDEEASHAEAVHADADPVAIEKKIRAVQKKLRRVQEMEDRNTKALPLDAGQKELLRSKPKLQRSLQTLLEQWAVLEPMIIQQQAQRMAALANSECAVCLDEYSADAQAIRTSCCGYHFHKSCLQQCIESKGHCPICFADHVHCRVVEQRVRSAAHR